MLTNSYDETMALGRRIGRLLQSGDILCLAGDLGAGKTALAAGIAQGWGALEAANSPTFVLIHEHRRRRDDLRLYHLDCYRLERPEEASLIGLEDILASSGAVMIEWPERILPLLPPAYLWIEIEKLDTEMLRQFTFEPVGARAEMLFEQLVAAHAAGN